MFDGTALACTLVFAAGVAVRIAGEVRDPRLLGVRYGTPWPVPFPVLSLDHIWLSRDLRALRCAHGGSWLSDHRAVIATVAVE